MYALAALQATALLSGVSAADKCQRFADERKINKLFSDGEQLSQGHGTFVESISTQI